MFSNDTPYSLRLATGGTGIWLVWGCFVLLVLVLTMRSVQQLASSEAMFVTHSRLRFPVPSSKKGGCRKPVLGVCVCNCLVDVFWQHTVTDEKYSTTDGACSVCKGLVGVFWRHTLMHSVYQLVALAVPCWRFRRTNTQVQYLVTGDTAQSTVTNLGNF